MELWNITLIDSFFLVGILQETRFPELVSAAIIFLYLVAMASNGLLLLLIATDRRLHVPMYFLLSQLSLMDLLFTTIVAPKTLVDYLSGQNTISFIGCSVQMFVALTLGCAEDILLAFMAYDRYVAIHQPLNYMVVMRPKVCWSMVGVSWFLASLSALVYTSYTMHFPFCRNQEIRHLLCEILPLLKLVCTDTSQYELMVNTLGVTFLFVPLSAILASYSLVLTSVFHIPTAQGKKKALLTCSSHLTVVVLYYGAATFMYVLPSAYHNPWQDNILSLFYTIVTPALNPLIYSLRNRDVLGALKNIIGKESSESKW
ncbi:olfactory receptor 2AG1-like [Macrotis lagotis]|uniref:olfactory receptor 2AG1-like n=1 Tax=Macrotis lagotis TaxID=92651 RepID=UPI003D69E780